MASSCRGSNIIVRRAPSIDSNVLQRVLADSIYGSSVKSNARYIFRLCISIRQEYRIACNCAKRCSKSQLWYTFPLHTSLRFLLVGTSLPLSTQLLQSHSNPSSRQRGLASYESKLIDEMIRSWKVVISA